jgi:hypothetical protein
VRAARGDRRITQAGGIVLIQFEHLAQAARAWGTGRVISEQARSSQAGEKPLAERVRELERDSARVK